jgi:hypothetical protein
MILRTDRLTLRPLQSTDVEAIASYSVRPEFIRLFAAASTYDGNRCAIRRTGRCQRSARSQGSPRRRRKTGLPKSPESAPPPSRSVDQFTAILWSASIAAGEARCSDGISRPEMD